MYANDTHLTLAVSADGIELNLNKDLASVSEWLTANKLTQNKSKTEFMLIGSRQRLRSFVHSPSLKIDGVQISQVPSTKSLGVYIDENLASNVHIENLSKKIASGIGALERIRPFVPHRTLRFIYNSLVKPHFDYCNVVWGNCNKILANDKLQKLQNRAPRVLTSVTFGTSIEYLFQVLNWRKLESQRHIQKACIQNRLAPYDLRSRFVERSMPTIAGYSQHWSETNLLSLFPAPIFLKTVQI